MFVCFSGNFISASYASASPWKAPPVWPKLASGSAAAKIPQTHCRKCQQLQNMEALPGQPVTKEKSSRNEGNVKISQTHQPCLFFVLDCKNHLLVWSTAFYEIARSLQFSAFHLSTVHFESLFAFLQTDRKSLALSKCL